MSYSLYGNSNTLIGFNAVCWADVQDFSFLRRSSVAEWILDDSSLSLRHYVENKGEEPLSGETALFRRSKKSGKFAFLQRYCNGNKWDHCPEVSWWLDSCRVGPSSCSRMSWLETVQLCAVVVVFVLNVTENVCAVTDDVEKTSSAAVWRE